MFLFSVKCRQHTLNTRDKRVVCGQGISAQQHLPYINREQNDTLETYMELGR